MTLGVLGTMVWDRIEHPAAETVERWGGISYSLAAAAAAAPDDWTIRPIIKLGADLADRARAFLDSVPGLDRPGGVAEVAEPNNRVHLRYRDRQRRDEHLTGGVPPWTWSELERRLDGLDGLYVNLISGFELDHRTAGILRDRFDGARYVDLHSLVLDVSEDGHRVPRRPTHRATWLGAFHVVQLNEDELHVMAGDNDAEAVARGAVHAGARAVVVTRGPRGVRWFARANANVPIWTGSDGDSEGAVRSGEVELGEPRAVGDPTGCGDVWGATCFVNLVQGERLRDAMEAANRAAARNVDHRGADGLYEHLRAGQ